MKLNWSWGNTVWKIQDFSVFQILCEIIYGESKSSKNAVFAIPGALNIVNLANFCLLKVQKFMIKVQIQSLKCVKMGDFALLKSSKLISRKI